MPAERAGPLRALARRLPSPGGLLAVAIPALSAAVVVLAIGGGRSDPAVESTAPVERLADASLATPPPGTPGPSLASEAQDALARMDGLRPPHPERVSIPTAGVDAPLEGVGATRDRIRVPPPRRAGWFRDGPRPGEPGRVVIIGHRDSTGGKAVFGDVHAMGPGDRIEVTDRRGRAHRYRVVGRTAVHKQDFPADAVYGHTGREALVIVTCGGRFDPETGYEDNILVYARPA